MYLLKLQALSITISVILFNHLQWQRLLKKIFRVPSFEFRKPFDCFRCNLFWIGQLTGLVLIPWKAYLWHTILPDWEAYLWYTIINFSSSYLIDRINGHN